MSAHSHCFLVLNLWWSDGLQVLNVESVWICLPYKCQATFFGGSDTGWNHHSALLVLPVPKYFKMRQEHRESECLWGPLVFREVVLSMLPRERPHVGSRGGWEQDGDGVPTGVTRALRCCCSQFSGGAALLLSCSPPSLELIAVLDCSLLLISCSVPLQPFACIGSE